MTVFSFNMISASLGVGAWRPFTDSTLYGIWLPAAYRAINSSRQSAGKVKGAAAALGRYSIGDKGEIWPAGGPLGDLVAARTVPASSTSWNPIRPF
jgi:hypothetical protein